MKKAVTFEGKLWYSVSHAAQHLHTTTTKVRSLMGDGTLRYTQTRANGDLYVLSDDLVKLRRARDAASKA